MFFGFKINGVIPNITKIPINQKINTPFFKEMTINQNYSAALFH